MITAGVTLLQHLGCNIHCLRASNLTKAWYALRCLIIGVHSGPFGPFFLPLVGTCYQTTTVSTHLTYWHRPFQATDMHHHAVQRMSIQRLPFAPILVRTPLHAAISVNAMELSTPQLGKILKSHNRKNAISIQPISRTVARHTVPDISS